MFPGAWKNRVNAQIWVIQGILPDYCFCALQKKNRSTKSGTKWSPIPKVTLAIISQVCFLYNLFLSSVLLNTNTAWRLVIKLPKIRTKPNVSTESGLLPSFLGSYLAPCLPPHHAIKSTRRSSSSNQKIKNWFWNRLVRYSFSCWNPSRFPNIFQQIDVSRYTPSM